MLTSNRRVWNTKLKEVISPSNVANKQQNLLQFINFNSVSYMQLFSFLFCLYFSCAKAS